MQSFGFSALSLFIAVFLLAAFAPMRAGAERVASIIDREQVDSISLSSKHQAKVFERKRAVPFLSVSPCITTERGVYEHDGETLKKGDVIMHEDIKLKVGYIDVKRFNDLAGSKDGQDLAGTIQTCQISEHGYKRAEEQCELIWLNFEGCAP